MNTQTKIIFCGELTQNILFLQLAVKIVSQFSTYFIWTAIYWDLFVFTIQTKRLLLQYAEPLRLKSVMLTISFPFSFLPYIFYLFAGQARDEKLKNKEIALTKKGFLVFILKLKKDKKFTNEVLVGKCQFVLKSSVYAH